MASKSDIQAGGAFVRLFLKDDFSKALQKSISNAGTAMKNFGATMTRVGAGVSAVGASMLAPIVAGTKAFADFGDELDKMSARTGVAAGALAELGFAAEQSGSSLESVQAVILKMNRRFGRVTAGQGTDTQVDAIEELGLAVADLAKMNAEQRFLALADAMANYGDDAAAAGLAQRVFGTSVDSLLPLLKQGKDGIEALREEARDLGIIPSEEEVKKAAEVTDAINRVRRVVKSMFFDIGAAMADNVLKWLDQVKEVGQRIGRWIKDNGQLIVSFAKLGIGIVAAGAAITTLGTAMIGAGAALTGLTAAISALGTVVAVVLSPAGLVVVGAAAALAAILTFTDAGTLAMATFSTKTKELGEVVDKTFGDMAAAFKNGDIEEASEMMWLQLEIQWKTHLQNLQEYWSLAQMGIMRDIESIGQGFGTLVMTLGGAVGGVAGGPGVRAAAAGGVSGLRGNTAKRRRERDEEHRRQVRDAAKQIGDLQRQYDRLVNKAPKRTGGGRRGSFNPFVPESGGTAGTSGSGLGGLVLRGAKALAGLGGDAARGLDPKTFLPKERSAIESAITTHSAAAAQAAGQVGVDTPELKMMRDMKASRIATVKAMESIKDMTLAFERWMGALTFG